mgnify:CR=1 FL=1
MAYNCYNNIEITGSKKQLKDFKNLLMINLIDGKYLNLVELSDKKAEESLYDSAGTRYMEVTIDFQEDTIFITGDSAWTPALELFIKLSIKFPDLIIVYDYEEIGCDFGGWAEIKNGDIDNNIYSYWEYKFKRDYEEALLEARHEIEYIVENDEDDELEFHPIREYISNNDYETILKEIKEVSN